MFRVQFQCVSPSVYPVRVEPRPARPRRWTEECTAILVNLIDVTGTNAVTAITLADGAERTVRTTNVLTWTHGASLVLPTGANITSAPGDYWTFRGHGTGVTRMTGHQRASGKPLAQDVVFSVSPFVSSDTAYTNGATVLIPHGLATAQLLVQVMMVCQSADAGYTAGQVILRGSGEDQSNVGVTVVFDATNVGLVIAASGVAAVNLGGGYGITVLDATKWKFRVSAFPY